MPEIVETENALGLFVAANHIQNTVQWLTNTQDLNTQFCLMAFKTAIGGRLGTAYREVAAQTPYGPNRAVFIPAQSTKGEWEDAFGALFKLPVNTTSDYLVGSAGAPSSLIGALVFGEYSHLSLEQVFAMFCGRRHAQEIGRHLDEGGLLLWVSATGSLNQTHVTQCLLSNGALDVHWHAIPQLCFGPEIEAHHSVH